MTEFILGLLFGMFGMAVLTIPAWWGERMERERLERILSMSIGQIVGVRKRG